ncbi:hypothetical protein [Streptomyces sp. NBC_01422]|uniref:hypothetical protein n=1 Tax=Streptomyces sp. NBC_01422 TaxID=2903859 RepID=UPI002E28D3BE|nr:hypothetical protein [Streptomyces sp. NBC_01422]
MPGTEELPVVGTPEQQELLQVVWDVFAATSRWPDFDWVDRRLDKQGLDAAEALSHLPEDLVRGFPDPSRRLPSDDSVLALTIAGAARCQGSTDVVQVFLALIRVLAETEQHWASGPRGDRPSLTARAAASRLQFLPIGEHQMLLQQARLLAQYEPGVQGTHGTDTDVEWTLQIGRSIRPFRAVQDIGAYWRARRALKAPAVVPAQPQALITEEPLPAAIAEPGPYVNEELIALLEGVNTSFSLNKLSALARELNANVAARHPFACQMLLRAILDHVPPAFEQKTFDSVVSNVSWSRTDRGYVKKLRDARTSADDALHRVISHAPSHLNMDDMPPRAALNALLQVLLDRLSAASRP